ncbi:hypothetical protein BH10PSE13_BH10PSE13_17480 [soil metagenome]
MFLPEAKARYDADAAIVRCYLRGLLTMELLADYEHALRREMTAARRDSPRVLMLFDSGESIVQPAPIVERIRELGQSVRQPGDRLAVVVGSALLKMQAERAIQGYADEQVFRTVAEAEVWLKS